MAVRPINVFGPSGSITPDMANFLSQQASNKVDTSLSQVRGMINGDTPLQLWAKNPVSFAVGGRISQIYCAAAFRTHWPSRPASSAARAARLRRHHRRLDVYEGYAEMIAPIISDQPFAEELQFEAGIRRSHYTINATPRTCSGWAIGSAEVQHHHLEGRR